ncbi:MAG: MATE family efflux transporter [Clostridiales bacterium]|nr:MATE family efflux transporter [Clostridiales bacterium]
MKNDNEILGKEKILKLMFKMGIPTLVAQLINLLYNMVDRIYIGRIRGAGSMALTGAGLALPLILIISAFSAFAGAGGAPLAAIALGKGDKKQAEKILANGFLILMLFSVLLPIVFWFTKEPLLYLIGASEQTFPYANDYFSVYIFGTIFVQISIGLNTFITAQGKPKTAMMSVLIGAVLNIVLDPIFIFVFDMGIKGAAVATVISQAVSAIWVMWFLTNKNTYLRIKKEYLKPNLKIILSIAALGVSPFIMQATESLISIVMNSGLKKYGGDIYVGSLTILASIVQLISLPVSGFAQGVQPIISYNYGAGNPDRVKKTFKLLLAISLAYTALLSGAAMLFPRLFSSIFTNETELINLASKILPVFVCGMSIFGIQLACQSTFMALGETKSSLFMALLRKVILLIPLAIILPRITNDVMSIYYAEPISDITSVLVCVLVFTLTIKKVLRTIQRDK